MSLLASRRLTPLLITQGLGAMNDNLFKNALVVLVLFRAAHGSGPPLVALAGGVFILPFMLFSATAGQLADRFEKQRLMVRVKLMEVALMALAACGFMLSSTPVLFGVLFGLGVQATFFGPLKYSVLPQHLPQDELVAGNGLVEAGTFAGILAGTIGGPLLFGLDHGAAIVSATGLAIALAGLAAAAFVPRAPAGQPGLAIGWNFIAQTVALIKSARENRTVWLCILALSWFWVMGATLLAELPVLVRDTLHADGQVFTLLLAMFSVGVGAGSIGCASLLRGRASSRLVPFATIGISVFLWDFARVAAGGSGLAGMGAVLREAAGWRLLADLLLVGFFGGVYSVPLNALIQERSPVSHLARMIGANNVLNALAMVVAAGLTAGLALAGASPSSILLAAAAANVLVAFWVIFILPQETVRDVFRAYFKIFHKPVITGLENLPPPGTRAVIVANHQSYGDGCFLAAFMPHAPTFMVNIHIARKWWARPFLAAVRHFPVDPANPFSAKTMVRVVKGGQTLVAFPEGRVSTTGALMKVYDGAAMVADKADALIVPVRIDGLQFSFLSMMKGKLPRTLFPRLSLTVLPPVRIGADPGLLGRARRRAMGAELQNVMEQSAFTSADTGKSLFSALLDAADRFGAGTPILEDLARAPLNYRRLILGACVLGRRLADEAPPGGHLGIMLPTANGAVVTFMALQAFGRVPAMLNFSAGAQAMLAACEAAQVTTVLCSRAFVERAKLDAVVDRMARSIRFVWLEDVRASLGFRQKLRGLRDSRRARKMPGAGVAADAPAVVLFTSGSEGTPKGVLLSHRNILANIAQVSSVVDFNPSDRVFNAMPLFHALGLASATLLPLMCGVRNFLYPSPLHYRIVPELIYDTDSTIAFATDTFLNGWARYAHSYDFYRMRYIFAGAERVRPETTRLYAERFGVRVLEGYGATETAPVLALNSPLHSQPGAAGRLLPGMAYRLDPVEGISGAGRLLVRGPNVMLGYLRASSPGVVEAPEDGWYDTGDICSADAEGFIKIIARHKRFAKIAGEMVAMPAAEALAAALWPGASHAVVAVPDARRGEALVLLTTQADAAAAALLAFAREQGAAELAVPRALIVVDVLPLLGSGKTDYGAALRVATQARLAARQVQAQEVLF